MTSTETATKSAETNADMDKVQSPALALQKFAELRLHKPMQKGRPPYIAAASGLVRHQDYAFVVADDELHLGIFAAADMRPEQPLRLLEGKLPRGIDKRKKEKPDFEVLAQLPATADYPHGALLILGSGSRANRNLGLLVALTESGLPHRKQSLLIDCSVLFAALQHEFGTVNIEGAVVQAGNLLLLQRGNKGLGTNAMVQLDLATLVPELGFGGVSAASLRAIRNYELGSIDGVALGFTDATCLPDGRLLAVAAAEDTQDAYADGAALGSCLCQFDRGNQLERIVRLDKSIKAEGIAVWSASQQLLAFVTDADDPAVPALLYTAHAHTIF